MSRSFLSLAGVALVSVLTVAGCGETNETTIIAPDDSVPSAAEMEAFYNQAPEEDGLEKD